GRAGVGLPALPCRFRRRPTELGRCPPRDRRRPGARGRTAGLSELGLGATGRLVRVRPRRRRRPEAVHPPAPELVGGVDAGRLRAPLPLDPLPSVCFSGGGRARRRLAGAAAGWPRGCLRRPSVPRPTAVRLAHGGAAAPDELLAYVEEARDTTISAVRDRAGARCPRTARAVL